MIFVLVGSGLFVFHVCICYSVFGCGKLWYDVLNKVLLRLIVKIRFFSACAFGLPFGSIILETFVCDRYVTYLQQLRSQKEKGIIHFLIGQVFSLCRDNWIFVSFFLSLLTLNKTHPF